jgi:hypothetical protein
MVSVNSIVALLSIASDSIRSSAGIGARDHLRDHPLDDPMLDERPGDRLR